jgi:hypothetical protein
MNEESVIEAYEAALVDLCQRLFPDDESVSDADREGITDKLQPTTFLTINAVMHKRGHWDGETLIIRRPVSATGARDALRAPAPMFKDKPPAEGIRTGKDALIELLTESIRRMVERDGGFVGTSSEYLSEYLSDEDRVRRDTLRSQDGKCQNCGKPLAEEDALPIGLPDNPTIPVAWCVKCRDASLAFEDDTSVD